MGWRDNLLGKRIVCYDNLYGICREKNLHVLKRITHYWKHRKGKFSKKKCEKEKNIEKRPKGIKNEQ